MRKMKALTVKMETVTLIGKGRQNPTCFLCIKCTKNIFLADVLLLGYVLYLDRYIFPWQTYFSAGMS